MVNTVELREQEVEDIITNYLAAEIQYADLCREEMVLQDSVPVLRDAIVARLIGTDNAKTGRPHSASSADEAALVDEAFLVLKENLRNCVRDKLRARGSARATYLRAKIARDLLRAHVRAL